MPDFRLEVYENKSVLVKDEERETFNEGTLSDSAKRRLQKVKRELDNGFLEEKVDEIEKLEVSLRGELEEEKRESIQKLVTTITPQRGRALAGLSMLQMCIKCITSQQSIRLHKGSSSSHHFSWVEGIPMRSLDRDYVTPVLRKHKLLKVNRDGVMMTRSLAENYPYSKIYKPEMRGAKSEWLKIVEWLEDRDLDPEIGLRYLISELIKRRDDQKSLEEKVLSQLDSFLPENGSDKNKIKSLISKHISESYSGARLLEVALHSLYQTLEADGELEGKLGPLSQMRSADKKAGVVGDVEIYEEGGIIKALDAKYGKDYLLDEVRELKDKLRNHEETEYVSFVTDKKAKINDDLKAEIDQIKSKFGTIVEIRTFPDLVEELLSEIEEDGPAKWLTAYVESLAQRRRGKAPIDEPCSKWLNSLSKLFNNEGATESELKQKKID